MCAALAATSGCASNGRTGAWAGGGVRAFAGRVTCHGTEATPLGAADGTVVGCIIGSEADKKKLRAVEAAGEVQRSDEARGVMGSTFVDI